jgi:putative SOS response-associated peptidase YedK
MCGRFALYRSLEEIKEAFDIQQVNFALEPSYNVAPTQDVAVVVQREEGNTLETMRWGLIPFWAKDPSIGSRMINARSETVHEKNSFKRPLKSQRCLIIADGFFEWQKTGQSKVPMFIQLKSKRPFGFAGLYDVWRSPEGEAITSCTIITTDANDFIRPIHDRMPVILPKQGEGIWLNPAIQRIDELRSVLAPYPADEMEAYEVSRLVNSPSNNTPECIRPIAR